MEAMSSSRTFTERLNGRVERTPDRTAFIFLENGEREGARLTFAQLDIQLRTIAGMLESATRVGDRVLLLYPPGLDFICALLGCLHAGRIAVPAYPPRKGRSSQRVQSIIQDCSPAVILTDRTTLEHLHGRAEHEPPLVQIGNVIATDGALSSQHLSGRMANVGPNTVALLQYTSGSTGAPKGVMVTQRNILSNMEVMAGANGFDESCVFMSWLPLFHDLGLFGAVLQALYVGIPLVLMDPAAFVQKPLRWLQAITAYRATTSAAPDSAYDLCVRKISEEAKAALDLKSWRQAFNGAEPVSAQTVRRFSDAFARCGFSRSAFRPVYGMAEATLYLTGQTEESPPLVMEFDAAGLGAGVAVPATNSRPQALVSCGQPWLGHRIRIVDPDTERPCPQERIGEIWATGPSVAAGYWNQPEESERTFRARIFGEQDECYLRTGDLGVVVQGALFVTGRLKDLIIIAGRNYYPQDLERTAEASDPALVANSAAAFQEDSQGGGKVVLTCEVRREALRKLDVESVAANMRRALAEEHDVELQGLVLLKPATSLRTSSGKIQRSRIRMAYQAGTGLEIVGSWHKPEPRQAPRGAEAKDITGWLVQRIADTAGVDPRQIDPRTPFSSYGLDSRAAVGLSGELQEWLGTPLPPTLAYDYPSIAQLVDHLTHAGGNTSNRPAGERGERDDIAIIGMSCRFPGAPDPEAFWRLLHNAEHAISPPDRRVRGLPPTALLEQVDQFDAEFFGINAREAETMDPQQRLLLEVAWETLEDAGIAPARLAGSRTAVIVGVSNCDYLRLAQQHSADVGPYVATGNALSVAANRISYVLDLRGPSWVVDTACSSSLVAVHQACRQLAAHDCDAALAGGANLILATQLSASFTQAGMLSPDGLCKTFDASANGYVRGEGVGLVLLKRLKDAIADGNSVLAVIRGSAVSQDGRSNGLTAPNGPAQEAAIRAALADARVQPRDIGYVETHGTGTPLGDPIELNSLVGVLNEGRDPKKPCWIGSVKTNIGHLESAAGIASLIKSVLMLRYGEIPPHLHYQTLNPHIGLGSAPFHIPTRVTAWSASAGVRIAGISSFGFGGTNAHLILSEAPCDTPRKPRTAHFASVVAISARSSSALRRLSAAYASFVASHPDLSLEDFAFTSNTGRTHFTCRAAIVASDRQELLRRLTELAKAGTENVQPPGIESDSAASVTSGCESGKLSGEQAPARQLLEDLARRYMRGGDIDWGTLYRGYQGQRLSLPHYPFERRRYWLDSNVPAHPLLGRRLPAQPHLPDTWTWQSRLDGSEVEVLNGHRLMDSPVLPYSAYVDMALCAASEAGDIDDAVASQLTLMDLTLHQPLFLRANDPQVIQTVLSRHAGGQLSFAVYHQTTRSESASPWRLCASASLRPSAIEA